MFNRPPTPLVKGFLFHNTGSNTCKICAPHDGKFFENPEDLPDFPLHQNCKCFVEVVFDDMQELLEGLVEDMEELGREVRSTIAEIVKFLANPPMKFAKKKYRQYIKYLQDVDSGAGDFARNFQDMVDSNIKESDKYFHAKANAEAAQRGWIGRLGAEAVSNAKEAWDYHKSIDKSLRDQFHVDTTEEAERKFEEVKRTSKKSYEKIRKKAEKYADKERDEDQEANRYGREQGRKHPDTDSKILVAPYRPKGLPNEY